MDEKNPRVTKLIAYFQELLDSTPDNPDPESDDAIERRLLKDRIRGLERRVPERATAAIREPRDRDFSPIEAPAPVRAMAEPVPVRIPGEAPKVRLVVIDDHEFIRRGIVSLLETERPGWKVVAEANNGESAIEMVRRHKPDIAIMNLSMPVMDGLAATRVIMREMPDMRIVFQTMHKSKQLVRELLEAGARGYVMTEDVGRELVKAVENVMDGKLYFTQPLSEVLLDGFLERPQPMRPENLLSKREIEIVGLLSRGKSNKEVATELNINSLTVQRWRTAIMMKLQLHSVQDLVRYAVKNKLVEL